MKFNFSVFLFICLTGILSACKQEARVIIRENLDQNYIPYKVEGCFILFDENKNVYTVYNQDLTKRSFTPASTFKIFSSMIGIETGVVKDENMILKWDSVQRQIPSWNGDQDLKMAYKNSTVWYYQEVARRVGGKQMKYFLDKAGYGNADTTGGIDRFWLSGGLRISTEEQIGFLKKLHDEKLPFSKRTTDIVKKIMIAKDTAGMVLRAKTGWASGDNIDIGWYVGYVESKGNVYYFANCIQTSNIENPHFGKARTEITYKILEELGVVEKGIFRY
jgi:beta-lactamase class D